jgi:hypothetical protein
VAQEQNQHLTTEQLSALLDKQLPSQEQAQCEAHLRACQQCQALLNDLRHTAALLHALPQPALPRSFVLTPEMLRAAAPIEEPVAPVPLTIQIEERRRQRQHRQRGAQSQSQLRRYILPRTLRAMSTLVAVLGLLFVLSAIPFHPGGASSASNGSTYAPASSTTSGGVSSSPAPAPSPQKTRLAPNTTTGPGKNTQPSQQPTAPSSQTSTHQPATSSGPVFPPALAQVFSVLNPGGAGGRAIDGLLLLILAFAGLLIARRWRVRQT